MGIVSFIISYHQYKKYKLGRNKVKKYSFKYIYMGNAISKLCKNMSNPIKAYEKRKTMKIYKEVVMNADVEENVEFIPDRIESI